MAFRYTFIVRDFDLNYQEYSKVTEKQMDDDDIQKEMRLILGANPNASSAMLKKVEELALSLFDNGHVDWLVERVQELERELEEHKSKFTVKYTMSLRKQNKRYREALEEIAEVIPIEYEHELELSTALIRIADIIINTRIAIENVGNLEGEE